MRAFVLGGSGIVGRPIVRMLAGDETVTRIAVAGRNVERAIAIAKELGGGKAVAVEVDGSAEDALVAQLDGYDIILNAATAEATMPAVRAAIRSGVHYCDVVTFGDDLDRAIELAADARAAGIDAVVANGIHPSITNLMGVHVAHQLDQVEQLQLGDASMYDFASGRDLTPAQWREDPRESLAELRPFMGQAEWMMHLAREAGIRTLRDHLDGRWEDVDPIASGVDVPLPDGGSIAVRPYVSIDPLFGALPTDLGAVPPVEMMFTPLPPQLHDVLRELATRVVRGDIDTDAAMDSFFATVEGDPARWLTMADDFVPIAKTWSRAVGLKDGRATRCTCWLRAPAWELGGYLLTSVALVAAAKLIMRRDLLERGVIAAEAAFNPRSFLDECAGLLGDSLPDGALIAESLEYLP